MSLLGARKHPRISGADALPGRANYFIGNDPTKWRPDIPTYARVRYEQVYRGIDLVYYGTQAGQLEYDFVVAPGADPTQIRLSFEGVDNLRVDERGDLVLTTAVGELRQHKPVIYQEVDGTRVGISGGYQLVNPEITQSNRQIAKSPDRQIVAFSVADYDRARPLVIDPTLAYSTFLGGTGSDQGEDIAVDATGGAYITDRTISANFPTTPGALDEGANGLTDAFVAKLNAAGGALVYTTFLGGSSDEAAFLDFGITVDVTGAAYVTGRTDSTDFPSRGAPVGQRAAGIYFDGPVHGRVGCQ